MKDVLKPPQRRETKRTRKKSWWARPETLRIAILVMRLVNQIAKFIDSLLG